MATWDPDTFNTRLEEAMTGVGVTSRRQLSAVSGVSGQQLSTVKKGKRPKLSTMRRIAPALGLRPVTLYLWAGLVFPEDLVIQGAVDDLPVSVVQLLELHTLLKGRDRDVLEQRTGWIVERVVAQRRLLESEEDVEDDAWPDWNAARFNAELEAAMNRAEIPHRERLAELAGVTPVALSSWRHDTARPEDSTLERIAAALGVSAVTTWRWAGYLDDEALTVPAGLGALPVVLQQLVTVYSESSGDERTELDRHVGWTLDGSMPSTKKKRRKVG